MQLLCTLSNSFAFISFLYVDVHVLTLNFSLSLYLSVSTSHCLSPSLSRDFLTECLFPSPTRPYELPWEQKTIWAIVFGLMMFVAIAGNGIVLWIVTGKLLIGKWLNVPAIV